MFIVGLIFKGGFLSKIKNVFNRPKNVDAPVPSVSSTNRLGTASRAAQQQKTTTVGILGSSVQRPTTAQKRPVTSTRGAGFMVGGGALGSFVSQSPSLYEKKEDRYS